MAGSSPKPLLNHRPPAPQEQAPSGVPHRRRVVPASDLPVPGLCHVLQGVLCRLPLFSQTHSVDDEGSPEGLCSRGLVCHSVGRRGSASKAREISHTSGGFQAAV